MENEASRVEGRPNLPEPAREQPQKICLEFYEVDDSSSDDFKKAMQIYAVSFPEAERRPEAAIERALRNGKIRMIACGIDGIVRMMALLCPINGTPFLLVEYIATSQEFRGQGIGSLFLKKVFELLDSPKFDYLLVEVEDPGEDPSESLDKTKARRIDFYRRLGMKELKDMRYLLPPMQGDKPTEMRLMVLSRYDAGIPDEDSLGEDMPDRDILDGSVIKNVITMIFHELYGRSQGDEILTSILEGIPDRISLV